MAALVGLGGIRRVQPVLLVVRRPVLVAQMAEQAETRRRTQEVRPVLVVVLLAVWHQAQERARLVLSSSHIEFSQDFT